MSKHPIKLTAAEAAQLASLIATVARPRSQDEVAAIERWLGRLIKATRE
jgi:hypothetical protein